MHIRMEQNQDIPAIRSLIQVAFQDALHTSHTEHLIVEALRHAHVLTISLVAEVEGRIIGHVAASPVSISNGATDWYGLGPVSVLPDMQRQGVGSRLIEAVLVQLRKQSAAGCVVLGEPEYYQRFGFKAEPSLVLADVPREYFMALSFSGDVPCGNVAYHAAFNVT